MERRQRGTGGLIKRKGSKFWHLSYWVDDKQVRESSKTELKDVAEELLRQRVSGVYKTSEQRFWAKVDKNGPVVVPELGPCWVWTGNTYSGYGRHSDGKSPIPAHRYSYELANGPMPADKETCHKCNNRPCVNPSHLYAGTHKENMQDRVVKQRNAALEGMTQELTDEIRAAVENMPRYRMNSLFGHARVKQALSEY